MSEGGMSDLLIDIQQGATAKELSKTYKIPMSVAIGFLQDYYGQKKGSRKEGFASDAQRRAAFASGYKEKGKKKDKKESVNEGTWAVPDEFRKLKKLQTDFGKELSRLEGSYRSLSQIIQKLSGNGLKKK